MGKSMEITIKWMVYFMENPNQLRCLEWKIPIWDGWFGGSPIFFWNLHLNLNDPRCHVATRLHLVDVAIASFPKLKKNIQPLMPTQSNLVWSPKLLHAQVIVRHIMYPQFCGLTRLCVVIVLHLGCWNHCVGSYIPNVLLCEWTLSTVKPLGTQQMSTLFGHFLASC